MQVGTLDSYSILYIFIFQPIIYDEIARVERNSLPA